MMVLLGGLFSIRSPAFQEVLQTQAIDANLPKLSPTGMTDQCLAELDQKLTLTIQYVCNGGGSAVPCHETRQIMRPGITGSFVIHNLADLVSRLVSKGRDIPSLLRHRVLGLGIMGSAVIQHLAKTRACAIAKEYLCPTACET